MYFGLNRAISVSPLARLPRWLILARMPGYEAKPCMASLESYAVVARSGGSFDARPFRGRLPGMPQGMRQDRPSPLIRPRGNSSRAAKKEKSVTAPKPATRFEILEMATRDLPAAQALSREVNWPHRLEDWQFVHSVG